MKKCFFILTVYLITSSAHGDGIGSFQNLSFDNGPLPAEPNSGGEVSVYLPGWNLKYDNAPQSFMEVDGPGNVGAAGFAVLGRTFFPYVGRFGLFFQNGFYNGAVETWSISQSGTVPDNANSMMFLSYLKYNAPLLKVDGANVPVIYIGPSEYPAFYQYGSDMREFAGKNVEITFYTPAVGIFNKYSVDQIDFTGTVIPEPCTPLIGALGVICIWLRGIVRRFDFRRLRMRRTAVLWFCVLCVARSGFGGEFQNLGFDEAPVPAYRGQTFDTRTYLPGWTLKYDGINRTNIDANSPGNAGVEGFAILNGAAGVLPYRCETRYSLVLKNGLWLGFVQTWEISRTGTVPIGIHSLQFKAASQVCTVYINGASINVKAQGEENGFTVYSCDVSAYAGQSVTLSFATRPEGLFEKYVIDSIQLLP